MKDAEEEAAGESGDNGDEETDSKSPPLAEVPVIRKTRQQMLKELAKTRAAATPTGSQEASSSEQSSSSGVREPEKMPPRPRRQKSPSQVEVAKEEELCVTSSHKKQSGRGIQRPLVPSPAAAIPIGSRAAPPLPVAK